MDGSVTQAVRVRCTSAVSQARVWGASGGCRAGGVDAKGGPLWVRGEPLSPWMVARLECCGGGLNLASGDGSTAGP